MNSYVDTKHDPAVSLFFYNKSTQYPQWSTTGVSILEGYASPMRKEQMEKLLAPFKS